MSLESVESVKSVKSEVMEQQSVSESVVEDIKVQLIGMQKTIKDNNKRIHELQCRKMPAFNQEALMLLTDIQCSLHKSSNKVIMEMLETNHNILLKLLDSLKKDKPEIPVHTIERANINKREKCVIPEWDESVLRLAPNSEKWMCDKPVQEDKSFQSSNFVCPMYFDRFVVRLLRHPINCCFHKKGSRFYVNSSDNDKWTNITSWQPFWKMVKVYLWSNYIEFLRKCPEPKMTGVVETLSEISEYAIPLTRLAMESIMYESATSDDISNWLLTAYEARNQLERYTKMGLMGFLSLCYYYVVITTISHYIAIFLTI